MLHILAKRHVHTLADFATSNVVVAFDYDGTLAPIVDDPGDARMKLSTRRLLTEVARRYPCVVISGRATRDLLKRIGRVPIFHVIGNHGVEPWAAGTSAPARIRSWIQRLEPALAPFDGVIIEDKLYTVTVHYRRARHRGAAIAAITEAVHGLRGARVVAGKESINLIPAGAATKGVALERIRRVLACDTAIYVGDDETDEDAFAAGDEGRVLAIRVGRSSSSIARYGLFTQGEIDDLLKILLRLRSTRAWALRLSPASLRRM